MQVFNFIMKIEKPKPLAPVITISGMPGVGKTYTACMFDGPSILIRTEDGTRGIPEDKMPDAFPLITKFEDVINQLGHLIKEKHEYKTLIIDSVSQLEEIFHKHVLETDPRKPKSINSAHGGYGSGYNMIAQMHARIRKACEILRQEKGMTIIFISHSEQSTVDLPDEEQPYTRYELRMNKKSALNYVDNVDCVMFIKLEILVETSKDGSKNKAMSNNKRVGICHSSASFVSKNRFGIDKEIEIKLNENPLKEYI